MPFLKTQYVQFSSPCDVVDTTLYNPDIIPQYRTVDVIGIENRKVEDIQFKNAEGQVINLARSIGTDKENVRLLKDSFLNQGWDITKVPPIVEQEDDTLYDGFSRHEGLLDKGQDLAPYLVVKRKEGFSKEDVIDEIGLGANNHSQSKKATIVDFKKRFAAYVLRIEADGKEVTTNDGLQWFASIPNSFSEAQIEKAIEDVFNDESARKTMESFTNKEAKEKGAKMLGLTKDEVLVYCKRGQGQNHYFKRLIGDALDHFDDKGRAATIVGYLARTTAEDARKARKELKLEVAKANAMMRAISYKYKEDPNFEFIDLQGILPQIIGEERELIEP